MNAREIAGKLGPAALRLLRLLADYPDARLYAVLNHGEDILRGAPTYRRGFIYTEGGAPFRTFASRTVDALWDFKLIHLSAEQSGNERHLYITPLGRKVRATPLEKQPASGA